MRREPTGWFSVFLSLPWGGLLPALLSFVSLGSAAAARVAVTQLIWPLLGLSVVFLAYAHYRVWILKTGHRTGKIVLVVNTVLVVLLWAWRLPLGEDLRATVGRRAMAKKVVVYSQPGGMFCVKVKEFLSQNNTGFTDRDVSKDDSALAELEKLGYMTTPVTVIDGEVIVGFNRAKLEELLAAGQVGRP